MIFRTLSREDIPLLTSSIEFGFSDGWAESMLVSAFESGRFFGWIANDDGVDVGYVTLDRGMDDVDIEEVFVFPDFRGKGVGKMLVDTALSALEKEGVKRVLLEVREGNLVARKLYEKCGFVKIHERKKYYSNGENAVIYLKEF